MGVGGGGEVVTSQGAAYHSQVASPGGPGWRGRAGVQCNGCKHLGKVDAVKKRTGSPTLELL